MCSRVMTTAAQFYMNARFVLCSGKVKDEQECWGKAPTMKKSLNACA